MRKTSLTAIIAAMFSALCAKQDAENVAPKWTLSYDAGFEDRNGAYAGGSEIMHLVAHKGKMFAANGYWLDSRWVIPPEGQKQSAQVLRLDSSDGKWEVDLDTGKANDLSLEYMKGNILKSVTFTRDAKGNKLDSPEEVLILAAGSNFEGGGAVSTWTRNDSTGRWNHELVRHGSSAGGVRWVPRDMEVHMDKITGVERIFLLLGNPGMISGVYDPSRPSRIRWDRHLEFPFLTRGKFRTRPLGIAIANSTLFFSESSSVYERKDGERPIYEKIIDLDRDTDTDIGGIRGITAIRNPRGSGDSLLMLWAPGERSRSEMKRLDPDGSGGYVLREELHLADLMGKRLGVRVTYSLGAHNMMYPILNPATGKTLHLIGFQGNIVGRNNLRWKGSALYGGAMYAIRSSEGKYSLQEVNNAFAADKKPLVSPRTFCLSPFGDNHVFVGGHDSSNKISDDMAWVFKAPTEVALGLRKGFEHKTIARKSKRLPGVEEGPIQELRIYQANEDRFGHLVKRFRLHTDRIFRKHGMKPLGYWAPTDGSPIKRRRFVYVLEHPSRYAAYQNWNRFTHDREWKAVLEIPEFKGLLSEKPISVFMFPKEFSDRLEKGINEGDGIFELRTYVTKEGKLSELENLFSNNATDLFSRHGMKSLAYWTPFDRPDSESKMLSMIHHQSRKQADENWKDLREDDQWRKTFSKPMADGGLLASPPESTYLKAFDFPSRK